jgi:hypothetical protein
VAWFLGPGASRRAGSSCCGVTARWGLTAPHYAHPIQPGFRRGNPGTCPAS